MKPGFSSGKISLMMAAAMTAGLLYAAWIYSGTLQDKPVLKIGVLHSLTGTMEISEKPLVDALRLAVDEANESGGVNGSKIEMVVADCRSVAATCAQEAEQLITRDKVRALFGCWTSSCRKAVKPVAEKYRRLLFYPVQYEGMEQSPYIFYTGAAPNQQLVPMVVWALQHCGKRAYLVGSDYVFPHRANRIARDVLKIQGGRLAAERYVPLGGRKLDGIAREIAAQHPDFVLNTLNGDSNLYFFRALKRAGIRAGDIPVFSTSIAEAELASIGADLMEGHYASWNYFQSMPGGENDRFIGSFHRRFGNERVLDDPMESSYIGVKLWLAAVSQAGSADTETVRAALGHQTLQAPEGIVSVDTDTQHLWKSVRIGRITDKGQFETVWKSPRSIRPAPFPFFITNDGESEQTEGAS